RLCQRRRRNASPARSRVNARAQGFEHEPAAGRVRCQETTMNKALNALRCLGVASLAIAATLPGSGYAHGFAGNRFFPATIARDDPSVADELSLPTLSTLRSADDPPTREQALSAEFSKRITSDLGFSLATDYQRLTPQGGPTSKGFGNTE